MAMEKLKLSSDATYTKSTSDMHTISLFSPTDSKREDIQQALDEAISQYVQSHRKTVVRCKDVVLGGTHSSNSGTFLFGFVRDVALFNLLTSKSEDGEDLYCLECDTREAPQRTPKVDLPSTLDDMDLSLTDMVECNFKAVAVLEIVRALDTNSTRFDGKMRKVWLPPLIQVNLSPTSAVKIVPAKFDKQYQSSVKQKVLTVSDHSNNITKCELENILDNVCIRERNVTFYIKNSSVKGTSPLVTVEQNSLDIHFPTDMQAKMVYFMLKGFEYVNRQSQPKSLQCAFKTVSQSGFPQSTSHGKSRGGRRDGPGRYPRGAGRRDDSYGSGRRGDLNGGQRGRMYN